ncbi:uncharacterized protein LOC121963594, partial [Plectropomus leopardus]|uniref:uncharacterized protein LOC121963594 n=1 Tax=Plectropomus leopardus TaxID=160734 RepID=UPI001C4D199A
LTSPWEPNSSSPPSAVTFDPDLTTCDPWHVHLGLHRGRCPRVSAQQLAASSLETTNTNRSSRRSSSSSESAGRKLSVDSTSDSPCSSREDIPSDGSRGRPQRTDPVQLPVSAAEQTPSDGSSEDRPSGSLSDPQESWSAGSDGSSTPVASVSCSPCSSAAGLPEEAKGRRSDAANGGLQTTGSSSAWRGSQKFSSPALRFTRQLSVGGVGSSAGVHHPFPNRKTPRISEAARRLGMYSSF